MVVWRPSRCATGRQPITRDETGWRTSGEGRALWTATTPDAAFFQIAEHCNREQFDALIGPATAGSWSLTAGTATAISTPPAPSVLVAPAARFPPPRRRARRAEEPSANRASRSPGACSPPGAPTSTSTTTATGSSRDRADPDPATRAARRRQPQEPAEALAPAVRQQPAQGLARAVDLHHDRRRRADQQPRRRALRAPVIHRKVSLGTQSDNGERFAERALSAAVTCRLQRRSLFTYLSELITAHNRGDPLPVRDAVPRHALRPAGARLLRARVRRRLRGDPDRGGGRHDRRSGRDRQGWVQARRRDRHGAAGRRFAAADTGLGRRQLRRRHLLRSHSSSVWASAPHSPPPPSPPSPACPNGMRESPRA